MPPSLAAVATAAAGQGQNVALASPPSLATLAAVAAGGHGQNVAVASPPLAAVTAGVQLRPEGDQGQNVALAAYPLVTAGDLGQNVALASAPPLTSEGAATLPPSGDRRHIAPTGDQGQTEATASPPWLRAPTVAASHLRAPPVVPTPPSFDYMMQHATVRGRALYRILDVPVLTVDVTDAGGAHRAHPTRDAGGAQRADAGAGAGRRWASTLSPES